MSATFLFPDKSDFSPDMKETARYLGYSRFVSPDQDVSDLLEKAAQEMLAVWPAAQKWQSSPQPSDHK